MDENLAGMIVLDRTNEEVEYPVGWVQSVGSWVSLKETLFELTDIVLSIVTFV